MKYFLSIILFQLLAANAFAKLNVLTTTTDLAAIVTEVGGNYISVDSICKGTQDPHYVEAKPSFMMKANRADLLIAVGLDLEVGYIPPILAGSRNPKIVKGSDGYLEAGSLITPLELPSGGISRADGDVHPYGNPHFTLDPIRDGEVAIGIAQRLGKLDPGHAEYFMTAAKAFQNRMKTKTKLWQARIQKCGVKKTITYHKTLTYFMDRFGIQVPLQLEPKPGVPPTTGHLLDVIHTMKQQAINLVLIENYFDASIAHKIKTELPNSRVYSVAVSVDGSPRVKNLDEMFEQLVWTIEASTK